jgi:hypothetical protein
MTSMALKGNGMPAISLHQPWASFIAIGVKPYETRHWRAPQQYVGRWIAIHAAKHKPERDDVEWWHRVSGTQDPLPLGAFVCTAFLGAIVPAEKVPFDEFGDYGEGRFAWHLLDPQPINPPIPAIGRQGFWQWERPL